MGCSPLWPHNIRADLEHLPRLAASRGAAGRARAHGKSRGAALAGANGVPALAELARRGKLAAVKNSVPIIFAQDLVDDGIVSSTKSKTIC